MKNMEAQCFFDHVLKVCSPILKIGIQYLVKLFKVTNGYILTENANYGLQMFIEEAVDLVELNSLSEALVGLPGVKGFQRSSGKG